MSHSAIASAFLLTSFAASMQASVIAVLNQFTTFPDAFVADIANAAEFPMFSGTGNVVGPYTAGGVTITSANTPFINGIYFASAATGGGREVNTPDIPGNVAGAVISNNSGFFQTAMPDLVLNFSQPISGFGATFLHDISGMPAQFSANGPATVQVFSGLNGTGTLLGSITDNGGVNILDFIGILDNVAEIQSAILSSSGAFGAFEVDAYGVSVVPVSAPAVPEPDARLLAASALTLCVLLRRAQRGQRGQTH